MSPSTRKPTGGPAPEIVPDAGDAYGARSSADSPSQGAAGNEGNRGASNNVLKAAILRLSKHTLAYSTAEYLSRIAGFLLIPLYTGYLTEADYGTRELFAITIAVLVQLAGINVTTAMHRNYFEDGDQSRRRKVVSTTLLSVALIAGLFVLGGLLVAGQLVPIVPGLSNLWRLTLGIFFFQMLREVQNKFLQAEERSVLYGSLAVVKLVFEISLQIWFLVGLGWGLEGLFLGVLISEALFCTILATIILPSVGLAFSAPIFASLAAFTLPLIPNGVFQFCLHSADRFLLGWLTDGTEAVGLYALAYKMGYMANALVLGPFLMIWYPFLFSTKEEERADICGRLTPYFMLIMTAVIFTLSLFAQEIIELMAGRPGYYVAWRAVPVIGLGYWFWGLFQMLQTGFFIKKHTGSLPWITGAAVLVNIYANMVLIPVHGFMGAAWATLMTFAVLSVITRYKAQSLYPVEIQWIKVFGPLVLSLVLAGVGLASTQLPDPWPWVVKGACLPLWLVGIWAGGFLDRAERVEVVRIVKNFRTRKSEAGDGKP